MDCMDSYECTLIEINKGQDEKGEYKLMKLIREIPCSCHPETCCHFDGKIKTSSKYKQYNDGSKVSVF